VGITALVFLINLKSWRVGLLACVLVVLGAWRAPDPLDTTLTIGDRDDIAVTVVSGVVQTDRYQQFQITGESGGRICAVAFSAVPVGRGDRLIVDAEIDPLANLGSGLAASLQSKGCVASAVVSDVTLVENGSGLLRRIDQVRSSAASQLETWVPGDRGALLSGLVIGDDARLSDDTAEAFLQTGTFHIVAISGANLTLLIALLAVLTIWLPRPWSEIAPLLLVWSYVLIGGAGPPTVRAGILATVIVLGRLRGRSIDLLSLTIVVAAVQAALWPHVTLGLSYRLSTVAMLVVVLVALDHAVRGWWRGIALMAVTSLAVNLAVLPLLPEQSRPALVPSVIANVLIAVPVAMAFAIGLSALLIGLISPTLGNALAVIAGEINGVTIAIVNVVARMDRWPAWVILDLGRLTTPFAICVGVLTVILLSPDCRRGVADLSVRIRDHEATLVPLSAGIVLGLITGLLVVVIMI
jgi:ComEC/Rec2-related protein